MSSEQKEKEIIPKSAKKPTFKRAPTLIVETTYEKVLSIINKVKEFIKKTSSETNTLIKDLEWVLKVITNKSLYTYELKQEKESKKNSEYNRFVNFVTKYNEEIIEMNKKHDIVSGILSIGKKGEILLKPSLCLKKILPDELKNMTEQKIKERNIKKKNNFIYVFGNTILNLYNQEMLKRKKRKESIEKSENSGNIEKSSEVNNKENSENKVIIKSNSKQEINKHENTESNNNTLNKNNELNNKNNNIKKQKLKNRQKSENILEKENINKIIRSNTSENKKEKLINEQKLKENNILTEKNSNNANIQTIKIVTEKEKFYDTKLKLKNFNSINPKSNNISQTKNYKGVTKLTKNEKVTFNNIKRALRNYYIKFAYIENQFPAIGINDLNDNFNNIKNIYKTNYNPNNYNYNYNFNKSKINSNIESDFIALKNYKYSSFPHFPISNKIKNKNIKQKDPILKNYKIAKENMILKSNEDKFDNFAYKTNNNNRNNNKLQLAKRIQITAENVKDNLYIKDNNKYNNNKSKTLTKSNNSKNKLIKIEEKKSNNKNEITDNNKRNESKLNTNKNNKKENIYTLVDKYFEEAKLVTDKDFHIFNFRDKVGQKNVLPIMGFVILKTLGLVDSQIISVKKLNSFLFTVSDNYKITTLYHNSLHGADVTQSVCLYFLNSNAEEICETSVLDLLGIIISAMGHDLGHPGLNNNFLINSGNDLAINYNDASVLENFHTSFLFKILRKEENNILEKLSTQNYKTIRKRMISQILATDMANHGETISLIKTKIKAWQDENQGREESEIVRFNLLTGNEKTKFVEQQSLLNYFIHVADLGHNCKRFEISLIWVELLCEEFWQQGDKEKAQGLPVSFMCDRNSIDVPGSQVGFLKGFIISSFDCLVAMFPNLKFTMENAENNIKKWKELQEQKRLRGWTPKKEKEKNEEVKNENKKEENK